MKRGYRRDLFIPERIYVNQTLADLILVVGEIELIVSLSIDRSQEYFDSTWMPKERRFDYPDNFF